MLILSANLKNQMWFNVVGVKEFQGAIGKMIERN